MSSDKPKKEYVNCGLIEDWHTEITDPNVNGVSGQPKFISATFRGKTLNGRSFEYTIGITDIMLRTIYKELIHLSTVVVNIDPKRPQR